MLFKRSLCLISVLAVSLCSLANTLPPPATASVSPTESILDLNGCVNTNPEEIIVTLSSFNPGVARQPSLNPSELDDSILMSFDPNTGVSSVLGKVEFSNGDRMLSDIAIDINGCLFGVHINNQTSDFYKINRLTRVASLIGSVSGTMDGFEILPDGTAYVAHDEGGIFSFDMGALNVGSITPTTTLVSNSPSTTGSSGDLLYDLRSNSLYKTCFTLAGGTFPGGAPRTNDRLTRTDLTTGVMTDLGFIRTPGRTLNRLWGMAANGCDIYGLSRREIYKIDPVTADATLIHNLNIPYNNIRVFGAAVGYTTPCR